MIGQTKLLTPGHRNEMLDLLDLKDKACAEVGVFNGGFAREILKRNPAKLYLIDPWVHQADETYPDDSNLSQGKFDQMHASLKSEFAPDPRVEIIRAFSLQASERIESGSLDFVYIDANHTLEHCLVDIALWYPKVRPGGWICGHDFTSGKVTVRDGLSGGMQRMETRSYPGVQYAVRAFSRIAGVPMQLLTQEEWGSWGIRKPEATD